MTTQEQVAILAVITTRDEAGRHFTEVYEWDFLAELERLGFLEIDKPVNEATGVPYGQERYSVQVTREGQELVEYFPEYWPKT